MTRTRRMRISSRMCRRTAAHAVTSTLFAPGEKIFNDEDVRESCVLLRHALVSVPRVPLGLADHVEGPRPSGVHVAYLGLFE